MTKDARTIALEALNSLCDLASHNNDGTSYRIADEAIAALEAAPTTQPVQAETVQALRFALQNIANGIPNPVKYATSALAAPTQPVQGEPIGYLDAHDIFYRGKVYPTPMTAVYAAPQSPQPISDKVAPATTQDEIRQRLRIAEDVLADHKRDADCTTLEDWKRKAEYYEYEWRCCSEFANRRIGELTDKRAAPPCMVNAEKVVYKICLAIENLPNPPTQWEAIGAFTTAMDIIRAEAAQDGEWKHCTPELICSGIDCEKTLRRPCECERGGSHDHFIIREAAQEVVDGPDKAARIRQLQDEIAAHLAEDDEPSDSSDTTDYASLEKEHFGDPDLKTGIYFEPPKEATKSCNLGCEHGVCLADIHGCPSECPKSPKEAAQDEPTIEQLQRKIKVQETVIAHWKNRHAADALDARRYRFLKAAPKQDCLFWIGAYGRDDAVVDKAMAESAPEGE